MALSSRLAAKEQRVAAMEAEKAAMQRELQAVTKEIQLQEDRLREQLRRAEGRHGALPAELLDLQRQLEALVAQPLPSLPASRAGSRLSSRPASAAAAAALPAPAPKAAAAQANSGAPTSPRIAAGRGGGGGSVAGASSCASARGGAAAMVDERPGSAEVRGAGQDGQRWRPMAAASAAAVGTDVPCSLFSPACSQAAPRAKKQVASSAHREQLLQEMARAEMEREAQRAAALAECSSDGDRRRLATHFELERQQAMALLQQLSLA